MNIILAILLYLNILVPGNTYLQSYINDEINLLEPQIEIIENDPDQMAVVNAVDLPEVPSIVILTDNGW